HAGVKGVNSCLKWNLGDLPQGAREQLVLLMTFGHNKQQALDILEEARQSSLAEMVNDVNRSCKDWLRRNKATVVQEHGRDLLRNRDADTGLVGPSFDLWEEKQALHTYTNAAATAALRESARIASTLGYEVLSNAWSNETKNLQTAIVKHLWDEQSGRFLKSVKPHDSSIDTAILGLTYPFRVLEPDDPRILSSSRQIENAFTYASE